MTNRLYDLLAGAAILGFVAFIFWIAGRATRKTDTRVASELVALVDRIAVARLEVVRLRDDIGQLRGTIAELRTETAIASISDTRENE